MNISWRMKFGARELVSRCIVLVAICSLCACRSSDVTTVLGNPRMDGLYPRANWKELSILLPENMLDKNHSRAISV